MNFDALSKSEKEATLQAIESLLLTPGWKLLHKELSELHAAKKEQALTAIRSGDDNGARNLTGVSDGLWMALQTPSVLVEILRPERKTT